MGWYGIIIFCLNTNNKKNERPDTGMADLSKLINMERVQMINPTPIYNKFKYVSAECGSGKTTALCNMINNTLNTKGSTESPRII